MAFTDNDVNRRMDKLKERFASGIFDLGEGVTSFEEYETGISESRRKEKEDVAKYGKKQLWFDILSALGESWAGRRLTPETMAGTQAVGRIRGRFGEEREDLMRDLRVRMLGEEAERVQKQEARETKRFKREEKGWAIQKDIAGLTRERVTEEYGDDPNISPKDLSIMQRFADAEVPFDKIQDIMGILSEQEELDLNNAKLLHKKLLSEYEQFESGRKAADAYYAWKSTGEKDYSGLTPQESGMLDELIDKDTWSEKEREMKLESHEMGLTRDRVAIAKASLDMQLTRKQMEQLDNANLTTTDLLTRFDALKPDLRRLAISQGAGVFISGPSDMRYIASDVYAKATPAQQAQYKENMRVMLLEGSAPAWAEVVKDKSAFGFAAQAEAMRREEVGDFTTTQLVQDEWLADGTWVEEEKDGIVTYSKPGVTLNELKKYRNDRDAYRDNMFVSEPAAIPPGEVATKPETGGRFKELQSRTAEKKERRKFTEATNVIQRGYMAQIPSVFKKEYYTKEFFGKEWVDPLFNDYKNNPQDIKAAFKEGLEIEKERDPQSDTYMQIIRKSGLAEDEFFVRLLNEVEAMFRREYGIYPHITRALPTYIYDSEKKEIVKQ